MNYQQKLRSCGCIAPELVMPGACVDKTRYSVIACDQYTAQPEYWEQVKDVVGAEASSLYYIMPEAWLGKDGKPDSEAHATHQDLLAANMRFFLVNGSLDELDPGMVYMERTLDNGKIRRGLVLALDMEMYDYHPGSKTLIRATEKTVEERIPARVQIRSKAPLECPHVMVLYADKEDKLLKTAENVAENKLYDFDLMQGAGHVKGFHITKDENLEAVADVLCELKAQADEKQDGMLFAIGDGNHSLAAAKTNWDNFKKYLPKSQWEDHPARFALVELVNLYDEALTFEVINRILIHVDPKKIQEELDFDAAHPISLQELQPKLDDYMQQHPEVEIDYIHGVDVAKALEAKDPENRLAICWDAFERDSLFSDVIKNGCLVRKTFSMGHAQDKRFYLEARRITKINKDHIVPNAAWNL